MKHRPWWRGGKDGLAGKSEAGQVSTGQGDHPQMVDVHEMARILHVPISWLYLRTRFHEIPCIRVGKYLRFEPDKVIAYYREQQSSKTMEKA